MSKKLILFGNGKNIQCICKILEFEGVHVDGFCVDDTYFVEPKLLNKPVYKYSEFIQSFSPDDCYLFSPMSGKNRCQTRKEVFERFKNLNFTFFSFINDDAKVYPGITIGENVYIAAFSVIQPDVVVKNNCYLGESALIAHNTVINEHCYIGANAVVGGGSIIGQCVMVGMGSLIRSETTVADNTTIGMGVSIHKDVVEPNVLVFSPLEEKWFKP